MSPDEIRTLLEQRFPQLKAETRSSPDGYAFFLGVPQRGSESNRIIRAVRQSPHGVTQLKLSVSSRIAGEDKEIGFSGGEAELAGLVGREIELFRTHFSKA